MVLCLIFSIFTSVKTKSEFILWKHLPSVPMAAPSWPSVTFQRSIRKWPIASCRAGLTIIPTCANASKLPAAIRMPASICPCMSA